jgi:hypothetical protein
MTLRVLIWLVVALVLVILFRLIVNIVHDFRHYRGIARKLFADYIRQHRAEVQIVSEGPRAIVLRRSDGEEVTFAPQQLYSKVDVTNATANEKLFDELLNQAVGPARVA